jgi:hypothetical protein
MKHKIERVEYKYFIPSKYVDDLKYCLSKVMLEDGNNKLSGGYKITSLYFDSLDDKDLNQKLDGIIYREKYRLRIYDKDVSFGKFEVKRKLNQVIEKLSLELSSIDVKNVIAGDYSCLEADTDMSYVAKKLEYENYSPKAIIEYDRQAYYLPFNRIRVTIDSNLSNYGFKNEFSNFSHLRSHNIQKPGYDILEVKFEGSIPQSLLNLLSEFPVRQSSISKYALSRIDSNTEPHGDSLIIPF